MWKRLIDWWNSRNRQETPLVTDMQHVPQDQPEDDIDGDDDSPDNLEFFSNGQILRTIKANIVSSSKAGPFIRTRRGIMVALDPTDTPGLHRLDMHGKTIIEFFHDLHQGLP